MQNGDNQQYNADELNPPEWLNKQLFEQVLQKAEKGKVKITDYTIGPGTAKSDHYASIMFRAKINYSCDGVKKFQSLIIKTTPVEEGLKKEKMGEMSVFETEISMYTKTLPEIEALLEAAGMKTNLCPKLFYCALEPVKCMMFDDLNEQGYTTVANRHCTEAEVKMALLKLARFHAVSFKLSKEGDADITSYCKGSMNTINFEGVPFFTEAYNVLREVLSLYEDLKEYVPHIKCIEENLFDECKAFFNAYSAGERAGIKVLNHGDFHMKNMMVRNVVGKLDELLLLDYQMCIFGSPALDVLYSITMLMSPDMRRNQRDELLYYYFVNFQETLKALGYLGHIPTLEEFLEELRRHKHWELYCYLIMLVMNYVFSSADGDLGRAIEDEEYRRKLFDDPRIIQDLRDLLPRCLYNGFFEKS